jgi:hypothetical protein
MIGQSANYRYPQLLQADHENGWRQQLKVIF